ncbi:hypothetical protein FK216_07465 [Moraxellaceae bacterium AER2_44_116]|nr:hypothetical protein [Moraxellaceae bacterium]TQC98121.1 hypothetical protein FK216_07465 [Moraxellaceae bacterium AER2_44_116]
MKKSFAAGVLSLLLSNMSYADSILNKSSANKFIQDFYSAIKKHDYKKVDLMVADNAKIKLHLLKMEQTFTLSKADYLQQIKANWHFATQEQFDLKDINYITTQEGLSGTLSLKLIESKEILGEKSSQEHTMEIGLVVADDMIKLSELKSKTTF